MSVTGLLGLGGRDYSLCNFRREACDRMWRVRAALPAEADHSGSRGDLVGAVMGRFQIPGGPNVVCMYVCIYIYIFIDSEYMI